MRAQMEMIIAGANFRGHLEACRQLGEDVAQRLAADSEATMLSNLLEQTKSLHALPPKAGAAEAVAGAELHEPMALASDVSKAVRDLLTCSDFMSSVISYGNKMLEEMRAKITQAKEATSDLGDEQAGWKKDLPDDSWESLAELAKNTINKLDGTRTQELTEELKQACVS